MTAEEFTEWLAFDALIGLPDRRADLRAGVLATLYSNVHRAPGQRKPRPDVFFPSLRPDEGLMPQPQVPRQDMESFRLYLEKRAARDAARAWS